MAERIRVVVVDDHPIFRAGVIQALALDSLIEIVGEGASAADAVELSLKHRPDLLLLDISMPGNGIAALNEIMKMTAPPRIAMLTVSEDHDDVRRAIEAGAVGYMLKGIKAPDLIAAVKAVKAGEAYVSPSLAARLLASKIKNTTHPLSSLTEQEKRTLQLVAMGLSNREIGERLDISEKTVKFHIGNIFRKLNVRNRVEATLLAEQMWGKASDKRTRILN